MEETAVGTSSSESEAAGSSDAGVSSSGVRDTASIAAEVMAELEGGGSKEPSTANAPKDEKAAPKGDKPEPKPEVDPDDFDAIEAETVDSLGRKRTNAIPHPRVKTMIQKAERKVIAAVAKELGISKAEAELKLEDVTGELTTRGGRLTEAEAKLKSFNDVEQILANDGDRFIQMLAQANPAMYGKFAKVLDPAHIAPAARVDPGEDDPEPQPTYDLGNGQMTYSKDDMAKLRQWDRRQALREARGEFEARLSPIEQERKAIQDREAQRVRAAEIERQAVQNIEKLLAKAAKWPGFKDHEAEIQKAVEADSSLDLHDAYIKVVFSKFAPERDKMKQELLEEINKQPRTTSLATSTAAPKSTGTKSTADYAREVMASMK